MTAHLNHSGLAEVGGHRVVRRGPPAHPAVEHARVATRALEYRAAALGARAARADDDDVAGRGHLAEALGE